MKNPHEQFNNVTAKDKRVKFSEAPLEEQIDRYQKIAGLLDKQSKFRDFFDNAYKYLDRVDIEGIQDKQKKYETFQLANSGLEFIESAVSFFLQIEKREDMRIFDNAREDLVSQRFSHGTWFLEKGSEKLNINKLTELFRWSLNSFIQKGEKLGRSPNINVQEADNLVEDLNLILEKVNRYLKVKR